MTESAHSDPTVSQDSLLRHDERGPAGQAVVTNDDPSVALCTLAGDATAEHDYRPFTYERYLHMHTSWRCVWCHTVACGDFDEADPCWLPYHHSTPHRSRAGIIWPLGGTRP